MELISTVFDNNGKIPTPYTCDGSGVNPSFDIHNVPSEAKSLVLIMEDPDVPKDIRADGIWYHWIVFNISPDTAVINEGHEPKGVSGMGTSGSTGYYPPCPPDGQHRYVFKLFALDTKLDLPKGATKEEVEQAMEGHVVDKAELVGLYERVGS